MCLRSKSKLLVSMLFVFIMLFASFAQADEYHLRYIIGVPSSANFWSDMVGSYSSSSRTYLRENCTNFSGGVAGNGNVAYATYTSYYVDSNGNVSGDLHGTYYHYSTQSAHNVSYSTTAPAYSTVYTTYVLHSVGATVYIDGNVLN